MFANKAKEQEIQAAFNATQISAPFGERKGFNMEQAIAKNVAKDPIVNNIPLGKDAFKTAHHSRQGSLGEAAYMTGKNFQKAIPTNKMSKKMNKEDAENADQTMNNETSQAEAVPSKIKGIEEEPATQQNVVLKSDKPEAAPGRSAEKQKLSQEPIGPQHDLQSQQMQAIPQKQCAEPQLELSIVSPEKEDIIDESQSVLIDQRELVRKALNSISLADESIESLKLDSSNPKYHQHKIAQTFRRRVEKHIQSEMQFMTQEDKINFADPQNLSEFSQPIFKSMIADEERFMVDPAYISKVQTEIRDTSRAFLLEWIIDVHRKFRLRPECLYVTQLIIDQYLSQVKIQKSQLHLLGVATLLIATKYEEIYPPELRELLAISENKFTKEQVLIMEKEILTTLGFVLTAPSAYRFLERYRQLSKLYADKEVFFYAQYILEVSILDASLLQFRPSQLAAASLMLSATQLKKTDGWNDHMERFTEYKKASLKHCIDEVRSFALEINPKFISTLRYKFSKAEYMKVANHTFNF